VVVRYGLQEHVDSFQTKQVDLHPRKKGEVIDKVLGDKFQIKKEGEMLEIPPLNLLVTVFKDREGGEIQARRKYTFRMIPPSQYIFPSAVFDPGTRLLVINAVHLANDPVTGPVEVYCSVGNSPRYQALIGRSRFYTFGFPIPPTVPKVKWSVGVEQMPAAFQDVVDTPTPPPPPPPPPAPPAQ
jgi:hypothetical protein